MTMMRRGAKSVGIALWLTLGPIPWPFAAGPDPVLVPEALAQGPAREAQYYCPMHPDQQSATPTTCPICSMRMVPMPPARFDTYPVDLRVTPTTSGARMRLAVQDPRRHTIVRRFALVHERPMHLFIVGDDLAFFAHEHPEAQPDGVFMIDVALPKPGPYMAIAEFLPEGGTPQTFQQLFTTGEAFRPAVAPAVDVAPKTADGVRVSIDASQVKAGDSRPLVIHIDDPATGRPTTDLQPYLGAAAHLLLVPADLTEAIHGHPDQQFVEPGVTFTPLVPRPGRYKLWVQFQRGGRLSTVSFVIDVL